MALVVNTNVASLNAQRQLNSTTNGMQTAMERLSSGARINTSADDAAGLAISTRMTSQVRGLTQAVRNANDGISIVQTAEGALSEVTDMLQRMRELSVQASNGSNSAADLASLNDEVSQLKTEIDRVASTTRFNNMTILDGSYGVNIQIGDQADQSMEINIANMGTAAMGETSEGLAVQATVASVSTSGSSNVADYQGRSITVAGASGSVTSTLSASGSADAVAAAASAALLGEDFGPATSRVISTVAYEPNKVDLSSDANRVFEMRVQGSSFQTVDFTDALVTQLGLASRAELEDTTNFEGDQVKQADMIAAMQAALDDEFSGSLAVTVGVDENGAITFSDTDGRQDRISIREGTTSGGTTGTFAATFIDSGLSATVMTNIVGQGTSGTTIDFGDNDSLSVFKVKVNGASAYTTVDFLDKLNDTSIVADRSQMFGYELVNAIQAEMDELFTGNDAVTVGLSADGELTFDIAGGDQTIEFAEGTYTASGGASTAGTFVAEVLGSGTVTIDNKANSLDLSSFNSLDVADMYKAFQEDDFAINVRVNGGAATDIDLAFYLQDAIADTDDFSGEDMAAALQAAFNDNFTGDDAVSVVMNDDGVLAFDVAGGAQVLEIREADVNADGTYGTFASNFIDSSIVTAATAFVINENLLGAVRTGDVDYGGNVNTGGTPITSLVDSLHTADLAADFEIAAGGGTRMTPFAVDDLDTDYTTVDTTATAGLTLTSANNVLTVSLDDETAVSLTIDAGEYTSLEALARSIQYELDASGQFEGEDALTVSVEQYTNATSATSRKDGAVDRLVLSSAAGKKIELGGVATTSTSVNGFAFFGDELDSSLADTTLFEELGIDPAQTDYRTHDRVDGGVDTTVGSGIVNLSVTTSTGSHSLALALTQDANTSFDDFATDLEAKANAALAGTGISFTATNDNGQFSLAMDQAGDSTFTLSGTIVDNALGGSLTGTGTDPGVTSMNDVVSALNSDLAAIGVTASYNADSSTWTFTDSSGSSGSASTVSVSGSDLAQLGMTAASETGTDSNATAAVLSSIDVLSADNATAALDSIDNALEYISAQRSSLGAVENRLTHTVNNLSNVIENTSASRSRIMDADYATEAANLAKMQVLQQAGTAMLSQANAQAQIVLSLLG